MNSSGTNIDKEVMFSPHFHEIWMDDGSHPRIDPIKRQIVVNFILITLD